MKITCPACAQHIKIDPEIHGDLQGHAHLQCPSCNGLVAVPPIDSPRSVAQVSVPADATIRSTTQAGTSALTLARTYRGINRNLLILGTTALLVFGGVVIFLASRNTGENREIKQNITKEIIHNSFFTQLIASGVTTEEDLNSIAKIRPYGDGFIGISKEAVDWEQAQVLARKTGSKILTNLEGGDEAELGLREWLVATFIAKPASSAWVSEQGEARIMEGETLSSDKVVSGQHKVLLHWQKKPKPEPNTKSADLASQVAKVTEEPSAMIPPETEPVKQAVPEAWWLEMDAALHEELMKCFTEGDPAACRELADKLPELVKSGEIKEIEWVESGSDAVGRNFPKGKMDYKIPGRTKNYQLNTGSEFSWRQDSHKIWFVISTPGSGYGSTLSIGTTAPLGKQWQPLFFIESSGSARVLLGRDLGASEDLWKAKAVFTLGAPIPEVATLTWMLGEGHPALEPPSEKQGRNVEFGSFSDSTVAFVGPDSTMLRYFGSKLNWGFVPQSGSVFTVGVFLQGKDKVTLGKSYKANGYVGVPGSSSKTQVTSYVEKAYSVGDYSNENVEEVGEAVANLILLP
ncbi:hypothetical protein [Haloferula sp.]|uniref:hypothetical protein n=1 Tax=Haloferula sp. TaxID=2497595 RepID=UPI003C772D25